MISGEIRIGVSKGILVRSLANPLNKANFYRIYQAFDPILGETSGKLLILVIQRGNEVEYIKLKGQ